MVGNEVLDERMAWDVARGIPLPRDSVDLLMVDSAVEHFADIEAFLRNAYGVLRPGGFVVMQFPGRYAPFAILNRALPQHVSRWLLDRLIGGFAMEELGFSAHYDRTHYSAFQHLCRQLRFDRLYHLPGYCSSSCFEFLAPLYLLFYAYDMLRYALGIRNLASYHLWVLQKPGGGRRADPRPLGLHAAGKEVA